MLWDTEWSDEMYALQDCMLTGACDVLKRHYAPLFQLDKDKLGDLAVLSSEARVHNIDAEEVVGMFSAALAKAPNATMSDQKNLVTLEIRKRIYQKKQKKCEKHRKNIEKMLKKVQPDDRMNIIELFPEYEDEVDVIMHLPAGDALETSILHTIIC
ncbi:hypothetical protein CAPTEDRAFT_195819 [Capitella teleta]|uniref:Uncharacterized protein n=1 Tax=Capitella teleta TaxID=283909 RepID=R7T9J6_CAPTE|nr:hypothetical protein CAPTEDRAFT_195819 [Capitella teleta]|eukprot:ELT90369.1 hypothetical protein CAPTEDRAFT_195819 [Capitella teleta]